MKRSFKKTEEIKNIHMVAICGMGMGSLAGLLREKGFELTGSDQNVYPPMSTQLEKMGISLYEGYQAENLMKRWPQGPDCVIIGNAVSRTNVEAAAVLENHFSYLSMPEALCQFFLEGKESIVVAGTHGKTTTASLASWLLTHAKKDPSFLVGGVLKNFEVSCHLGQGNCFVVEGDEYDTAFFDKGPKFVHYKPNRVILGAVEFDHADIYKDLNHVLSAFEKLIEVMPKEGHLYVDASSPHSLQLASRFQGTVTTYGLGGSADLQAVSIKFSMEGATFELRRHGKRLGEIRTPLSGFHNIQNLLGVIALLLDLDIPFEVIAEGIVLFQGVKRRQEIRGVVSDVVVMDDFAHHPTAIKKTIEAIRFRFPGYKLWAVFEPRSNTSRRNSFQKEFALSFLGADRVFLADLFMPEKIPEGERLDVLRVCREVEEASTGKIKATVHKNASEIIEQVLREVRPKTVLLIMSNGGFDNIHERLLGRLQEI
ncbi:MAG: UDP-N-acetylmuramate:L-alanyl-gamma-D-glutamyl-meso-diaminopimelate ligase [bacterium]|nr:UDP-N-acetylmuramate:L-alanyl-gamma-D-glutamyl-meso-diaminopimelate ligase [bacterium]